MLQSQQQAKPTLTFLRVGASKVWSSLRLQLQAVRVTLSTLKCRLFPPIKPQSLTLAALLRSARFKGWAEVRRPAPVTSPCPSTVPPTRWSNQETGSTLITPRPALELGSQERSFSTDMPRRGRSAEFLKNLRRKYRLGEFQTAGKTLKRRQKSRSRVLRIAQPKGQWGRSRSVGDRRAANNARRLGM